MNNEFKVTATLTPKDSKPVIIRLDWNDRSQVRVFAELADLCLRNGGTVLTEGSK